MGDDPLDLDDPDTREVLQRAAARGTSAPPGRVLCPACTRRQLTAGQDLCGPCAEESRRASKRGWWGRQGDYGGMLADGLTPRDAARRWLTHQLRKGPRMARDIHAAARRAGIAGKTLRRAREELQATGVLVTERGGAPRGQSRWRLLWQSFRPMVDAGALKIGGRGLPQLEAPQAGDVVDAEIVEEPGR